MSDTLKQLQVIKSRHDTLNRFLTLLFSGLVCAAGFVLWWAEVPLLDRYKPATGLALMGLAVVFYKIPYFVYLLNRRRFSTDDVCLRLMGRTWKQYRMRILNVYQTKL